MFNCITNVDVWVEQYINSLSRPGLAGLFYFITQFGGALAVIVLSLSIIYFLWKKKNLLKPFILAILTNEIIVYSMKKLIGRLRPMGALKYGEYDYSMPSGHAAASILIYGFICYLIMRFCPKRCRRNALSVFLAVFIFLIGFSRLYLDVHYLSDVAVGYLLGGTILFYLIKSAEKAKK